MKVICDRGALVEALNLVGGVVVTRTPKPVLTCVKLAAADGELVPLDQLWRSLQNEGWDKASFDRTVLSLAEENRVSLQRHNFPYGLGDQERAQLVGGRFEIKSGKTGGTEICVRFAKGAACHPSKS